MPRGNRSADLPDSGIPGLIARRSSSTLVWVVNVTVPVALRPVIRTSSGKPLTRVTRSTGTGDLSKAKKLYPRIKSGIEQWLSEISVGCIEPPEVRIKRELGEFYSALMSPAAIKWRMDGGCRPWSEIGDVLIDTLVEAFGGNLVAGNTKEPLLRASILKVLKEVDDNYARIAAEGFFAEESVKGKQLRAEAQKPMPVTFSKILDDKLKTTEYAASYGQALRRCVQAWSVVIKDNKLSSFTVGNIRKFLLALRNEGWGEAGPVSGTTANKYAGYLKDLLVYFNQTHVDEEKGVEPIQVPIYAPLKTDRLVARKDGVIEEDKSISTDDLKALLDHAYIEHCTEHSSLIKTHSHQIDRRKFLWLLMLATTGMRRMEPFNLCWKDYVIKDGYTFFHLGISKAIAGKRWVPINPVLQRFLDQYKGEPEALILDHWSQAERPPQAAGNWLRRFAEKLRKEGLVSGRCNPHSLRHFCAGELGNNPVIAEAVTPKALGHGPKNVTQKYGRRDFELLYEAGMLMNSEWAPPNITDVAILKSETSFFFSQPIPVMP